MVPLPFQLKRRPGSGQPAYRRLLAQHPSELVFNSADLLERELRLKHKAPGNIGVGQALPLEVLVGKEMLMKVRVTKSADRPKRSSKELKEEQRRKKEKQKDEETTTPERTGPYDDPHRRPA